MTYITHGHASLTMQSGLCRPSAIPLGAALVLCHGWRSPERIEVQREPASGRGVTPLLRWTRPVRRAA